MKKISDLAVRQSITQRPSHSYKGDFGRVLVIGGNEEMGGAIILSASAAVYSGAGLVTTATHPSNKTALLSRLPESMFVSYEDSKQLHDQIQHSDVVLIGPGLGKSPFAKDLVETVIQTVSSKQIIILDGDALDLLSIHQWSLQEKKAILTPHLGEWEKLSGLSPDKENPEDNQKIKKQLNAQLVLKKHRTQIYWNQNIWENPTGNPGMATGGMGDTLAGMIAGFTAQFDQKERALIAAVYLHSKIGDHLYQSQHVTLPTHIIENIPHTMKKYAFRQMPTL